MDHRLMSAPVQTRAGVARLKSALQAGGAGAQVRDGAVQITAFIISMGFLILLLAILGYDTGTVAESLWDGSVGSPAALGLSLREAVPLILCAAAVWLAFQAGLFNVGADGQLQVGGLCALVICLQLDSLPGPLVIALALVVGMAAGALWAGIAGALKTFFGATEVISTIMLNFIAFQLVSEAMTKPLQSETTVNLTTDEIPEKARLGMVFGDVLAWGFLIAVVVSVAVILYINRTTVGLRLRAMGLNSLSVRHAGIRVRRYWLGVMCASGALAGLAGALVIVGMRFVMAPGWAPAWGFLGILIAFLALRSPFLLPVWGLLFGMLAAAGPALKADAGVSPGIVVLMQTLPVIVLFAIYALWRPAAQFIRDSKGRRTRPEQEVAS